MMTRLSLLSLLACLALACNKTASEAPAQNAEAAPASEKESPKETPKADAHDHSAHKAEPGAAQEPSEVKRVFFVSPATGAKVKSPVKLVFGVEGMGIRKAGEDVKDQTSGHHHIIVDGKAIPKGTPVPKDATHIHYGGAQTETELKLSPGKHSLTMQLADGAHISYGEALSATIEVEVTE